MAVIVRQWAYSFKPYVKNPKCQLYQDNYGIEEAEKNRGQ